MTTCSPQAAAWLLCLLTGASLLCPAAQAQVRVVRHDDDRLRIIAAVDVVVHVAGEADSRCPLSRPAFQRTAVAALRAASIPATLSERAPSEVYSLLVHVQSVTAGAGCATAVTSELVAQVNGVPDNDPAAAGGAWGSILVGQMTLLRETSLHSAAAGELEAVAQQAIRAQVTRIAGRVRDARP